MQDSSEQKFNRREDVAPVGLDVYWYPRGACDSSTTPRNAKIRRGIGGGAADLSILPTDDGAVLAKNCVWHRSDGRVHDHNGNISMGAELNGFWEFTPWSWDYINRQAAKLAGKPPAKREVANV